MSGRFMDHKKGRIVSICLLAKEIPPPYWDSEWIASYARQLSHIPEDELREVIWSGVKIWSAWPSVAEIRQHWQSGAYKTPAMP